MGKYLIKRIAFSIVSIVIVMFSVMALIYGLMNRDGIFIRDGNMNKRSGNTLEIYKYNKLVTYGYLEYVDIYDYVNPILIAQYGEQGYSSSAEYSQLETDLENSKTYTNNQFIKDFIAEYEAKNYEIIYLKNSGKRADSARLLAVYEYTTLERTWKYFSKMITIEKTTDVAETEDIDRYIRLEWDGLSNMPAIVGSGTTHKYLVYFDDLFPYIHQNFIHINLGKSTSKKMEYTQLITKTQSTYRMAEVQTPVQVAEGKGETTYTASNYHTVTYSSVISANDLTIYTDNYINASTNSEDPSMLATSFIIGFIATIISYLLGLPLGLLMARKKDKLADKLGNLYILFIMAVPSLAYIYIFAGIGTKYFNLPYKYANAEVKVLGYILPIISLALPSAGGLMKWMRRYMIDQMNSDYVKFARSQGLSEGEIYSKHIFPNALIYIIHGIPGNILGCLTGAIITERVYGIDGVGRVLTNAINDYDNPLIIACTFFFTILSVVSMILGDLLLAKYDPRISLAEGGN